MKRYLILTFATIITNVIVAQSALDALTFSQIRYEGTARTMAMGNAFTSLGGDTYAISINPASSGIYRYSEFTFTPSLMNEKSNSLYLGNINDESWTRFTTSNVGFVGHIPLSGRSYGLKSINFGVAINRLNNYSSRSFSRGTTSQSSWLGSLAESLGGIYKGHLDITDTRNPFYEMSASYWKGILAWNSNLLDPLPDSNEDYIGATENIINNQIVMGGEIVQEFYRERKGNLSEVVFNAATNFSDRLFIGANIGIQSLTFSDFQRYSESAVNPANFDSQFDSFTHTYRLTSNGIGVNFKLGVIALPFQGLRLGASISTPVWHYITDEWDEKINARYSDGYTSNILSPYGDYTYRINSPFRWNIGASYVLGNFAVVSVDYEGADYSAIEMMTESGNKFDFINENNYIKSNFKSATVLRAGAEIRPVEFLALRAGYTLYENPERYLGFDQEYISGGVGIRGSKGTFFDIGFQKRLNNSETFKLYSDYTNHIAPEGRLDLTGWKLLFTLGFRF